VFQGPRIEEDRKVTIGECDSLSGIHLLLEEVLQEQVDGAQQQIA
jgi:hypothetical protein